MSTVPAAPGAVAGREVRSRLGTLAGLEVALVALGVVALTIGDGLQDTVTRLTESMPEALTAFIPGDVPGGYVVGELFNLLAPAAFVAWAVLAGASTTAGEERDGTMAVLSSLPLSRRRLLAEKVLGLLLALVVAVAVFGVVTALTSMALDNGLTPGGVAATCLHLLLLAAALGAVALLVAAVTGSVGAAAGTAGALAVASWVADSVLPLADLDPLARLSPWYYYASSTPLANGVEWVHVLVLALITLVATTLAFLAFARRDLEG